MTNYDAALFAAADKHMSGNSPDPDGVTIEMGVERGDTELYVEVTIGDPRADVLSIVVDGRDVDVEKGWYCDLTDDEYDQAFEMACEKMIEDEEAREAQEADDAYDRMNDR